MAYNAFTIPKLQDEFGLSIDDRSGLRFPLPTTTAPVELKRLIDRDMSLAIYSRTEKARSEFLVAPVLAELRSHYPDRISLFSGVDFSIDDRVGLNGRCDYIVARSPLQLVLAKPVCMLVEAKREDLVAGIPQCLAEMIAAQRFNGNTETVYGCVTSGTQWRFLQLDGKTAFVDTREYAIQQLDDIYAILTFIALGE